MPRRAAGLTTMKVKTAPPGRYGDGKGLYLLVRSADARFWLFRDRRNGHMREMGLGSFADVTLAEAREKAADLHRKVKAGIDPLAEREARAFAEKVASHQATVRAITFADVADRYITAHEAGWRNPKHRQQWRNTLDTYAMPILGPLPVSDVDTGTVMRVLDPSGGIRPKPRPGFVAGSSPCWITRQRENGEPERTRLGGVGISTTCYRHPARSPRWSTMRPCRGGRSAASWPRLWIRKGLRPWRYAMPS